MKTVQINGKACVVEHDFGAGRFIVKVDGKHVFIDAGPVAGEWEIDTAGARTEPEERILKYLESLDAKGT